MRRRVGQALIRALSGCFALEQLFFWQDTLRLSVKL